MFAPKWSLGRVAITLCVLALSSNVLAEGGEIIRAEYGAGHRWRDVTETVRALVGASNSGENEFRVENRVLGGDSDPEHPKTLRIRVRAWDGQPREFTFNEHEVVSIAAFRGGDDESWQIVKADYGARERWIDVTRSVQEWTAGRADRVEINNRNLHLEDPAPGQVKTLRILARHWNGREREFRYQEKESVDLTAFRSGSGESFRGRWSELHIWSARYGAEDRTSDVSQRLQDMVRDNTLSVHVNNRSMGADPAPGVLKSLLVEYEYHGQRHTTSAAEDGDLRLPGDEPYSPEPYRASDELRILRARYGAEGRTIDVTDRVQSKVRDGRIRLHINNDTMGGDPAPKEIKSLLVEYEYQGRRRSTRAGTCNCPSRVVERLLMEAGP